MDARKTTEEIQRLAVRLIATHPAGENICLIGGFRYRFLDGSGRSSADIDYHWEGDGVSKQEEIVTLLQGKLLPEVKARFGYDGSVQAAAGPETDSPFVRTILLAFHRGGVPGSRIEIPLGITSVPRADPPEVRTAAGTVYLTVSDADMVESKVIALLSRQYVQARDMLDIFLFRSSLRKDSAERLGRKFVRLGWNPGTAERRMEAIVSGRDRHVRALEMILEEQMERSAAAHIVAAGGGGMVFDEVVNVVAALLLPAEGETS
jgi:hypothetical protein